MSATTRQITVKIGRFGGKTKTVKVPRGATVKQILQKAKIDPSGTEKVWLGGEKAGLGKKLQASAILNVVGSFEGGL